jgi:hypothetical protein
MNDNKTSDSKRQVLYDCILRDITCENNGFINTQLDLSGARCYDEELSPEPIQVCLNRPLKANPAAASSKHLTPIDS